MSISPNIKGNRGLSLISLSLLLSFSCSFAPACFLSASLSFVPTVRAFVVHETQDKRGDGSLKLERNVTDLLVLT